MILFFVLLGVCAIGGFTVTALIWVFFWTVGIFDVPLSVRKRFGLGVHEHWHADLSKGNMLIIEYKRQAGMTRVVPLSGMEQPWRLYSSNSASAYKPHLNMSQSKQTMAQPHAFARS